MFFILGVQDTLKQAGSFIKLGKYTASATMRSPPCRKHARGGARPHRGRFLLIKPNRIKTPQCLIPQLQSALVNPNPVRIVPWILSRRSHALPLVGPNTVWNLSLESITAWPPSLWVDLRVRLASATACSTSASLWCLLTCWRSLTCWDSPARGRRGSALSHTPARVRTWRPLSLRE